MQKHETIYNFHTRDLCQQICGQMDSRLGYLEELLNAQLVPRDKQLYISSTIKRKLTIAYTLFNELQNHFQKYFPQEHSKNVPKTQGNSLIDADDSKHWQQLYKQKYNQVQKQINNEREKGKGRVMNTPWLVTARGLNVEARGERQEAYINSLLNNLVTLGIGPAGTGKTFLSIALACSMLNSGQRSRLIITRPAVEAGESLGFLPGDFTQKIDPYLRPLYDALYECLGRDTVNDMLASSQIEIAPLAYMRGRTLNDAMVLLDESQNCTMSQLKMFLTRLGRNSSMCISGDITQVDLPPAQSGLAIVAQLLGKVNGVGVIYFQKEDILRNPMVAKILAAFEKEENHSPN